MRFLKSAVSLSVRFEAWERTTLFSRRETFLSFCTQQNQASADLLEQSKYDVDEEEIEKKRLKTNLPGNVYRKLIRKEVVPLENKEHFRKKYLRMHYGRYGERCGLNPGIAWPTREELLEIIEHDKMFHPPLQEMLDSVSAAEEQKTRERLEYEAEVDKNMAKLETYKKEYHAKLAKKEEEALLRKQKQKELIEEISEHLGYDVDPKDPRFQEAVEMKKKEEKKAQKLKKQQESYEKMVARLANLAAQSRKAESEVKTDNSPDSVQSNMPVGSKENPS